MKTAHDIVREVANDFGVTVDQIKSHEGRFEWFPVRQTIARRLRSERNLSHGQISKILNRDRWQSNYMCMPDNERHELNRRKNKREQISTASRACTECGSIFQAIRTDHRLCSHECRDKDYSRKYRKQRQIETRACKVCGGSFKTLHSRKIICGTICYAEMNRRRRRKRYLETGH